MTSVMVQVCDALIADLQSFVPGLGPDAVASSRVHLYAPWTPEAFLADGYRHLAVWPTGEEPEVAEPLATGFHDRVQFYHIVVWEPAGEERGVADDAGTLTFLDLYESVIGRLYVTTNQNLGGSWRTWFASSELDTTASLLRWFRIRVESHHAQAFT